MKETICKASVTALLTLLILSAMCATAAADLPATFDWRDVNGTNHVTPVKDQSIYGPCSGCWAYAAIAVIEAKIMIEHGIETDLSEHYYISDCWLYGDCSGGYGEDVFTFAQSSSYGVPTEDRAPGSNNYSCNVCDNWRTDAWFIDYQGSIFTSNPDIVKATIIEYGPVYATIDTHAIMIVGWNDTTGKWICKNSYGTNPVTGGYIYEDYDSIAQYVRYVVGTHKHWNEWDDDCYIADAELSLACWHWCTNTPINGHLITDAEMSLLVYQWSTGDVC